MVLFVYIGEMRLAGESRVETPISLRAYLDRTPGEENVCA